MGKFLQPVGSFPPNVYYRDTYGLQHYSDGYGAQRHYTDSITTVESDDTATTKSTGNYYSLTRSMYTSAQ
ncbi:unnamed protein product [Gongylonema pulchrum]|uniref:Uncharacterized protein n=1 Tax=Gongylonema pulchrum TaxID=637853 RepID=A0A183D1K7_9BILA|nr:unnamed protein product [Gongylonema pulchrum]